MQIDFAIKTKGADAPTLVKSEIVDMIAFEQEHNVSVSVLAEDPKVSHLTWLAWHACKRTGKTDLDFLDWAATLEDITGEEAEAPVPLESKARTGSLLDSQ